MAHQGAAATAEFQKILDHPGVVGNEIIGALAHLGLGRAYALEAGSARPGTVAGTTRLGSEEHQQDPDVRVTESQTEALQRARAAYQDFFTLWKDADPDIPILKQAKAEYAKLT
jgi:hypothetical protein